MMKFYRVGAKRVLTRDRLPAYILSQNPDITHPDINDLQCLTLTSHTSLWVDTQNKKLPVRSGYHLFNALRFEDAAIQLEILGCRSEEDIPEIVAKNIGKQSEKFAENIEAIATYIFRSLIMHSFSECRNVYRNIGMQKVHLAYHLEVPNVSVGVKSTDTTMDCYQGKNLFGEILTKLAKEFAKDDSKFLNVEPIEFTLLGSAIRNTRRLILEEDKRFQPSERILSSFSLLAASNKSKSKSESYLEN